MLTLRHTAFRTAAREMVTASTTQGGNNADNFLNNLLVEAKRTMDAAAGSTKHARRMPRSLPTKTSEET